MVLNSTTLFLALTVGGSTAVMGQARGDSVTRDYGRVVAQDSVRPLASRTLARVGIGAEPEVRMDREPADSVIDTTGVTQRRHAVEYSDWYYKRLTIHKVASYTTIPLFVTEYILGDKLYNGTASSSTRSTHQAVAAGIGVLFGVNTVTGVWNLWESRHESQGRARRMTHGLLMLASDAGFVATAALAPEGNEGGFDDGFEDSSNNRSTHRTVAITSMGVSLASYLMMYFWK
jgi:hypothetical protein